MAWPWWLPLTPMSCMLPGTESVWGVPWNRQGRLALWFSFSELQHIYTCSCMGLWVIWSGFNRTDPHTMDKGSVSGRTLGGWREGGWRKHKQTARTWQGGHSPTLKGLLVIFLSSVENGNNLIVISGSWPEIFPITKVILQHRLKSPHVSNILSLKVYCLGDIG